jgi:four helix bundle protein
MDKTQYNKQYNLGERTFKFAQRVIGYVERLNKSMSNVEIGKQLIRSGCSVGGNYIEAEDALGKKDFLMRIKICRKEAKESEYWLKLSYTQEQQEKEALIKEATEIMKIFGSIVAKSIKSV